jgi:hypothetical protein
LLERPFQTTKAFRFYNFLSNKKNLTAEVAENAEVEIAKCPDTGCKGKEALFSTLPGRSIRPMDFKGAISALSASSSLTLLSSIPED